MKNHRLLRLAVLSSLLPCSIIAATILSGDIASAQEVKPKVKIGKDTTFIEGPLTKDGYIDYVRYVNDYLKKGVTPQNNAAVLLLKAYPGEITDERFMKKYCKALGISPLPLKGDYFKTYYRMAISEAERKKGGQLTNEENGAAIDAMNDAYERATKGPWKKSEIPVIANWLEAVDKHLDMVKKASMRSRYYHPMLNFDDEEPGPKMISLLLPQAQSTRSFARALVARAMMYLGEGEIEKCTADILTMRRLGNHIAQGATLVEQLIGLAIVGLAQDAEQKMALSGLLDSKQLIDYRDKMNKLRIKSNMARSFTNFERLMYLDSVQHVMKGGTKALNEITGLAGSGGGSPKSQTQMRDMLDQVISNSTDWSYTMKAGNEIYDKYERELKIKDWEKQDAALDRMEKEIQEISADVQGTGTIVKAFLGGPEYRGKMMGKIFVSLLLPALNAATTAEKRVKVMDDLTYVVLSAAAHKAETGQYPESIDSFSKKVVDQLPLDKYANADFRYRREGTGFIAYSIGPNRRDDQGHGVFNERHRDGDDYGVGYETVKAKSNTKRDFD